MPTVETSICLFGCSKEAQPSRPVLLAFALPGRIPTSAGSVENRDLVTISRPDLPELPSVSLLCCLCSLLAFQAEPVASAQSTLRLCCAQRASLFATAELCSRNGKHGFSCFCGG